MNFALLAKAKSNKAQEDTEFNVEKYLNKVSKLSDYMDIYFINQPVIPLDSCQEFDKMNSLSVVDPSISLKEMFGG